ncbi:LysR family transcriptional regulator [Bdellovibrio reynosensis]|uniref:LysR family transcriptional regulator n=1 Tax=Bdellovibrio reynosensis TaxID=2835041 RepID=A0ABY4C6Q0_9BACT|nr:LysR family transcriptional regulator [Bdellovibrio reynosensis]UOF00638.1 LysR family transcriptional regulator [Bdellovibrio reynosensis]
MSSEPNLYHLRYFVSAAQLGSVAAAAKAHNVSQPAISQGIRKLEESLECSLMIHTKNRFKLTEEGKLLVQRSGQLFQTLEGIKLDLKGSKAELSGTISIATADTLAQSLLPKSLLKLKQKHPQLGIEIGFSNAAEVLSLVKTGKAELGIVVDDGRIQGVDMSVLHEGSFCCVFAKGIRISHDLGFIVTQEAPGEMELQKIYKKKFSKPAPIAMKVESWEVIAKYVTLGLGIGFIPDLMLHHWDGIRVIEELQPLAEKQKYRVLLIHRGTHQLSRQAQAFVALLT